MPTFLRIMEILSCSMAGFLPCLLLLIYPFRNHLRLKSFLAGFLSLAMAPALLYYDILSALGTPPVSIPFPLLRSAAYLLFALLVIHAPIGKVLLNTFSVINLSLLIHAAADLIAAPYTLNWLLATTALQVLLLIPYALNLALCLAPTLNSSDAPVWKLLWAAPAIGTPLGCTLVYTGAAASSLTAAMAAALILAAAAAAITLHQTRTEMITLILKKEKTPIKAQPAAAVRPMPDPVQVHYNNLQARIAESEHSYQELLLQVMSMEDDLEHQDYDQLRQRLNALRKQLSAAGSPTGNSRIDPIITYYTRQALLSNAKISTNITLPEWSAVSEEHTAVLIGCLMDNALDACREQTAGTRRIAAASYLDDNLLQIGIKYTYAAPIDPNCEQLNICRQIAAGYGGKLTVIDQDSVVQIVVTLNV